jgi:hypothetical protein
MNAENLGRIPPNTAALNLFSDNDKYEIILQSNEKKSEGIIINVE